MSSLCPLQDLSCHFQNVFPSCVISLSHLSFKTLLRYHSNTLLSTAHPPTHCRFHSDVSVLHSSFISTWSIPPWVSTSPCLLSLLISKFLGTRTMFLDFHISTGTQAGLNKCLLGTLAKWEGSHVFLEGSTDFPELHLL